MSDQMPYDPSTDLEQPGEEQAQFLRDIEYYADSVKRGEAARIFSEDRNLSDEARLWWKRERAKDVVEAALLRGKIKARVSRLYGTKEGENE